MGIQTHRSEIVIVLGICILATACSRSPDFSGNWKFASTKDGAVPTGPSAQIELNIKPAEGGYVVDLQVPRIKAPTGGRYWDTFLKASQVQQENFALQMLKQSNSGLFLKGENRNIIKKTDGSALEYHDEGKMICIDIGCFKKSK